MGVMGKWENERKWEEGATGNSSLAATGCDPIGDQWGLMGFWETK